MTASVPPSGDQYLPSGQLQGDDKTVSDKGTSTGFNGDTYGADTSQTATNRIGSITGATKSDQPDYD
jgi:hypothetical protein